MSIVIPCYNEEGNIQHLVEKISAMQKYEDVEFILVDNGSSDNTGSLLERASEEHPNIRKAAVIKNIGYGNGIKCGIKEAQGDFVGWTHADAQVDPEDVLVAYRQIEENGSQDKFFKGIRDKSGRSLLDRLFTRFMGIFVSNILGTKMFDINGQPNVYPGHMREAILQAPDDVMIEVYSYYIALRTGLEEKRYPVTFGKRLSGKSRLAPNLVAKLRTSLATIQYALALRKERK